MIANQNKRKKVRSIAAIVIGAALLIAATSFYNKFAWSPDHEDLTPIVKDILQHDLDIKGEWATPVTLQGSGLTIQKKKPNLYSVDFSTGGCLDDWSSKRKATYSNGILCLNKPVKEYPGAKKYDTMYAVKVDGHDYLLSQASIRILMKHYSKDGVIDWPENIQHSAFHRKKLEQ